MTLHLISTFVAALVALAFAISTLWMKAKLRATEAELDIGHDNVRRRDGEIAHLRKGQAQKIDRALFMLAKVRAHATQTKRADGEPGGPALLQVSIELTPAVLAALEQDAEDGHTAFRDVLVAHLRRRAAKVAQATGVEGLG